MGTVYREAMFTSLRLMEPIKGRVLDVGCHDGFLLSHVMADLRVGVDLHPVKGAPGIQFIQADALHLPFRHGSFNRVYALEIIEHIQEDDRFADELINTLASSGELILSTPSAAIRLNPPFLTGWISWKWGHFYRRGYTPSRLKELFNRQLDTQIQPWNGPALRFWYLLLNVLQHIIPKVVEKWLKAISRYDYKRRSGQHGYWIMTATRSPDKRNNKQEQ